MSIYNHTDDTAYIFTYIGLPTDKARCYCSLRWW